MAAKPYFPALDGMRGTAALVVPLMHFPHVNSPFIPFVHMPLAVDFFFILSGFVLAFGSDADLRSGALTAGAFIRRRLIRLYPVYFIGVLLGALVALPGVPTTGELARVVAANLIFIPAEPIGWGDGHLFVLNGVLWSLMWEMAVSLAYGFAGRRLDNTVLAAVVTVAGVLLVGFAFHGGITDGWQRSAFFEGGVRALFGFSTGIAMARLMKAGAFRKIPKISGWAPMAVLCAILFLPKWEGFDPAIDVLMIVIAFPLIVVAGALAAPGSRTSRRIFRGIGDISYPLYAIHAPVLVIAFASGNAFGLSLSALCILSYALSLAIAHVTLRRWDTPVRARLNAVRMVKAAGVKAA